MKKIITGLLAFSVLSSSIASMVEATSVTGIKSLNNEESLFDYKLDNETSTKIAEDILISGDEKEIITSTPERVMGDLVKDKDVVVEQKDDTDLIPADKFKSLTTPLEEQQLAWLVENNILSRESQILVSGSSIKVTRNENLYDYNKPLESMSKSEFLMGAYKGIYGVINSRPLVIKTDAWRNAEKVLGPADSVEGEEPQVTYEEKKNQKVSGTGEEYRYIQNGKTDSVVRKFEEGDYVTLVSPNVFELYLKQLVDKGIVDVNTVSDMSFRETLSKSGTSEEAYKLYPRWYSNGSPYMASSGQTQKDDLVKYMENTNVWGRGFTLSSSPNSGSDVCSVKGDFSCEDRGYATGDLVVTDVRDVLDIKYFVDETVDAISALKYVEAMLRLTEKDMTDTEAKIISYKYGANYLNLLDDEDRKTVMFLTAKGILNFDDITEYKNLYGSLTKEFGYKLQYRLANKNARLDFSKIQLTDSDNFWIQNGFSQVSVNMNLLDESQNSMYRREDGSYIFSPIPDVETVSATVIKTEVVEQEGTTTSFLGIKFFSRKSSFAARAQSKNQTYSVKKIFDDGQKYTFNGIKVSDTKAMLNNEWVNGVSPSGGKSAQVTVDFKVQATTSAMAIASVDSRLAVGSDFLFKQSGIAAVTKYEEDGKEVTLVPASIFKSSGPQLGQKILVMEDKVLKNLETGVQAVLLTEANTALIGTHVITGEDLMVTSLNGEKYYNLEIIRYLLSNTYISNLDPNSIYVSAGVLNEKVANVVPSTGSSIGKTYVAQFEVVDESGDGSSTPKKVTAPFINITQLTTASNFLIKKLKIRDTEAKKDVEFNLIMHLVFTLPDKNANFLNPMYKNANPNFGDVNNFVYERPTDPELRDWWDNNIEISNAFANEIYGTNGVQYVKSGYLVPNISILYDTSNVIQGQYLTKFLQSVGTHLSDEWVKRFMGDLTTYNKVVEKGYVSNNKSSQYYPEKVLTVNKFPMWVHAMFNNSSAGIDPKVYSGQVGADKNNTSLWRYLIADRSFSYEVSSVPQKGIKVYQGGDATYVETNGGAIYRRLVDSDPKFQGKLVADGKAVDDSTDWKGKKSFTYKPTTRTEAQSISDWEGKTVTDPSGKFKFLVKGVSGNKLRLVDIVPVIGVPVMTKKGKKDFVDITGSVDGKGTPKKNIIKSRYEQLYTALSTDIAGYNNTIEVFDNTKNVAWYPNGETSLDKYILIDKGLATIDKDKDKIVYKSSSIGQWYSYNQTMKQLLQDKQALHAYTSIELDSNLWTISSGGSLVARKTFPFLQVGNIYFSGINQGVTDSIIAKSAGVRSVSKIEEGATLLIGDMEFTKRGSSFVSAPQENIKAWSKALKNANDSAIVKSNIFSVFAGMGINKNSVGKTSIDFSNIPIPIVSFMKNPKLAVPEQPTKKITILGGDSNKKGYIYSYKDKTAKPSIKAYTSKNIPSVSAVVFSVDLDKVLVARALDTSTKSYQLVMSTNSLSDGYLENVPFFSENLSMDSTDDVVLMADKTTFKRVTNASEIKDEFLTMFKRTFQGDLLSLLKAIITVALIWMILASWMVFMILRTRSIDGFLNFIKNPGRGSEREGVDLIKVMSLGLFNMESSLSLGKLVIGNVCIVILIRIIIGLA